MVSWPGIDDQLTTEHRVARFVNRWIRPETCTAVPERRLDDSRDRGRAGLGASQGGSDHDLKMAAFLVTGNPGSGKSLPRSSHAVDCRPSIRTMTPTCRAGRTKPAIICGSPMHHVHPIGSGSDHTGGSGADPDWRNCWSQRTGLCSSVASQRTSTRSWTSSTLCSCSTLERPRRRLGSSRTMLPTHRAAARKGGKRYAMGVQHSRRRWPRSAQ